MLCRISPWLPPRFRPHESLEEVAEKIFVFSLSHVPKIIRRGHLLPLRCALPVPRCLSSSNFGVVTRLFHSQAARHPNRVGRLLRPDCYPRW